MKNFAKFFGIIVLATVIGFTMAACDDGNGGDNDVDLPGSSGINEVVGKTLYLDQLSKIVFADIGTTFKSYYDGTRIWTIQNGELLSGQNEELSSVGSYSYNSGNKTITLAKEYVNWDGKEVVTYDYQITTDGDGALLAQEKLPADKGSDELQGKTFTSASGSDTSYAFAASGNTYTVTSARYGPVQITETGTYAYDSAAKKVWMRPEKLYNYFSSIPSLQTMPEYYAYTLSSSSSFYSTVADRAADTNSRFVWGVEDYSLNPNQIGHEVHP